MSWKDKAVALYRRFGAPVKFAAKLVLGAALPGGSAVVDLVGQLLDCVHETAKDQIELDEAQAPAAADADLKRVEEMFDVLSGDMAKAMESVARLEKLPDLAAQQLDLLLKTDAGCQAALSKLNQLARRIERLHDKADEMNAKLDELLRRNNVPPGSQPQYHVSITDEREKALLLHIKAEYRKLPAEQRRAVDLNKLGDALRGAGLAAEAKETYVEAAGATADRLAQAAAHYKTYLADLEQRHWDDALAAVLRAAALDGRWSPFPLHDYTPQRILGAGGFGTAFLCRDPHMDRDVVVKALHEADLDRSLTDVFAEAKVLLQLSRTHPAIIGVQRCGYADAAARARPYIVLDYFPGVSLQTHLDALPSGLPLADFLAVVRPVAEGMRAAHAQGVLHRDLKPDNVLVLKEGDQWDVRLIDFGLAVRGRVVRSSVTRPSYERSLLGASIAGTAKYAPPEQMGELNEKPGPYSDVYAFGKLCLYTLFKTTEPGMRHWKAVPEKARDGLREVLEKCKEQLPANRYASFEPVVQELEAIGRPKVVIPPAPDSAGDRFWAKSPSAPQVEKATPQRKSGELYTNSIGMNFAWIPPGTFLMGSPPNEPERCWGDETQHKVTLTKGFWLGVHLVTQAHWQAVMGTNPSRFQGDDNPVEQISWDEAAAFCKALGKKDGKIYRLPTEAEWEYACRAGTTTPFHCGAAISTDQVNYNGNFTDGSGKKGLYRQKTTPVGRFSANRWGLFDMHGNVNEWCQDWYIPYPSFDIRDPQSGNSGKGRVLRGGSWGDRPSSCRAASRAWQEAYQRYDVVGCRVVLCLD